MVDCQGFALVTMNLSKVRNFLAPCYRSEEQATIVSNNQSKQRSPSSLGDDLMKLRTNDAKPRDTQNQVVQNQNFQTDLVLGTSFGQLHQHFLVLWKTALANFGKHKLTVSHNFKFSARRLD
jgi:hypothetical protein